MALPSSLYDSLIVIAISIVIFVVGILIGKALGWAIRNLLEKVGINDWIERFAIGRAIAKSGFKPSDFFGRVTSWIVYASTVILALYSTTSFLNLVEASFILKEILVVYIGGFVKAFVVIIIGFLLVDSFVGYLYKAPEIESELEFIGPVAEYLRILLYIVTVVFALEQGGIEVAFLSSMLIPIMWGITIMMVIIILSRSISKHFRKEGNGEKS
ncbi:MAG: mechanosensitive ion channel family protein [Fervidicoccaceae archaeon]